VTSRKTHKLGWQIENSTEVNWTFHIDSIRNGNSYEKCIKIFPVCLKISWELTPITNIVNNTMFQNTCDYSATEQDDNYTECLKTEVCAV
jgi:hypothetical protein